jgi:hypothetical protein
MKRPRLNRPTGMGIVLAILGFAVVFPAVAHWSGVSEATVSGMLASLPGILVAALRSGDESRSKARDMTAHDPESIDGPSNSTTLASALQTCRDSEHVCQRTSGAP